MTLKIHPFGSTNASNDGKTYEVNTRAVAFQGPHGTTISGIQTQRCNNNNGSMDLVDRTGAVASNILAVYGTKHNLGIGSGSMTDCVACFSDGGSKEEPGENPFVAYLQHSTDKQVHFSRCGVIGPAGKDFYHHSTGDEAYAWVAARQVWAVDTNDFTGGFNELTAAYYRLVLSLPFGGNVSHLLADLPATGLVNAPTGTMADSAILVAQKTNNNSLMSSQGTFVLTNCAFYNSTPLTGGANSEWWANGSAAGNLTMNYCIYFNGTNGMQKHASGTYVGNHNVYRASNVYNTTNKVIFTGATFYTTLSAWQSYQRSGRAERFSGASGSKRGQRLRFLARRVVQLKQRPH